ncbi:MAG: hypothetical protein ABJZ55_19900 [Fuerstiella sp.]
MTVHSSRDNLVALNLYSANRGQPDSSSDQFTWALNKMVSASLVIFCLTFSYAQASIGDEFSGDEIQRDQATSVLYTIRIEGTISTPDKEGAQSFPLTSNGEFQFRNLQDQLDSSGLDSLRALRQFRKAETRTIVDKSRETLVSLPTAYGRIHTCGHNGQLISWHPQYALLRSQADLLRMPFDVLVMQALMPTGSVKQTDSWNAPAWVVPALTGLDATVTQTVQCRMRSLTDDEAEIEFEGSIEGAVTGSASRVNFGGEFTVDRKAGMIRRANVTMKEKRTAGPVSPGINVTATIQWSQDPVITTDQDASIQEPNDQQLLLSAKAPGGLKFRHSRQWHLFHETDAVMMLRMLKDGRLIGQANFSKGISVKPGTHTPDAEFDRDISQSVSERKGKVLDSKTHSERAGWRFRQVQAKGAAAEKTILWDYYLCSASSGQQFSVVFSHANEDVASFEGEPSKLLKNFTLPQRKRPALPFR